MAREENMGMMMMMMMMMQYALQYLLRMVPPSENGKHENDQIWLAGKRNRQTRICKPTHSFFSFVRGTEDTSARLDCQKEKEIGIITFMLYYL